MGTGLPFARTILVLSTELLSIHRIVAVVRGLQIEVRRESHELITVPRKLDANC